MHDLLPGGLTEEGIVPVPGLASRWVRLADGRRAHYMTAGTTGPAVILLHGGIEGSSGTAGWRWLAPFLGEHGFRVYAPDRPGFGLADTSHPAYLDAGPKEQVEFIRQFADALCLDRFHLSGNSMGCLATATFLAAYPERVLSAALIAGFLGDVAGFGGVRSSDSAFSPNPSYEMPAFDGTHESMRTLMEGIILHEEGVTDAVVDMRVRAANRQREARTRAGLGPLYPGSFWTADPDEEVSLSTRDRVGRLTVPIVYFYGLLDVLFPVENGFAQEDAVQNIQFFYPDGTGHQGQTDRPELFNRAFLEFFRDGRISWETAVEAGVSLRRPIAPRLVAEPAGGLPEPAPELYTDPQTLRAGLVARGLATATPVPQG